MWDWVLGIWVVGMIILTTLIVLSATGVIGS